MKRTLALALLSTALIGAAHAAPTQGLYSVDAKGNNAPFLPISTYNNKKTVGASGLVSMTCPQGTGQYRTTAKASADFDVKPNSATFPAGDVTDGTAGDPASKLGTWTPSTTYVGISAASGTTVYLSCWSYK